MMLIDTHCHLDFPEFNQDRDEVIERARQAGVCTIINVASSVEGSLHSVELARKFNWIYASIGVHPHYAKDVCGKIPVQLLALVKNDNVVAVGEVGLDYYRDLSPRPLQQSLFKAFIALAQEKGLPLIIHSRDAHEDTMSVLKDSMKSKARGVVHCFSAGKEYLDEYLRMGFYISFTGNLTFKNNTKLRSLAKGVPLERLLLETDAPFLAPQKFRGKRNEPSYITELAGEFSRIHGVDLSDIAEITTRNARELFSLKTEGLDKSGVL